MLHHVPGNRESRWPLPAGTAIMSRRALVRAGAGLGAGALIAFAPAPAAAATQTGWRFCTKCRGLFFQGGGSKRKKKGKNGKKGRSAGNTSLGVCPAGGRHAPRTDLNYVVQLNSSFTDPNLFKNFQQCQKCRGLFFEDSGETGICPAGGTHTGGSSLYELWQGATIPGMDDAWDECSKCHGVFNWAGGNAGSCPASGGHLRSNPATRYTLFTLS